MEVDILWETLRTEFYTAMMEVLKKIADKEDATAADAQIFTAAASAMSEWFRP